MNSKITKIIVLAAAFVSFTFGAVAMAEDYGLGDAKKESGLPGAIANETTIPGIVGALITYGLSAIGIVFFFLVLYAGFLWMSAMGNTEKAESAKAILEAAVIGLVLVLGAYAITNFVFTGLTTKTVASSPQVELKTCDAKKDGTECNVDGGTQCVAKKCVPTCAAKFPGQNASCVPENSCARVKAPGFCPGATDICCRDIQLNE